MEFEMENTQKFTVMLTKLVIHSMAIFVSEIKQKILITIIYWIYYAQKLFTQKYCYAFHGLR